MMKILNAEPQNFSRKALQILQSVGNVDERILDRAGLLACIEDYDVVIIRLGFQMDREMIDASRRLRVIMAATTGLDHIDLDYAAERGVDVLSLRGETEFLSSIPATAELTWGLLLALTRKIPQSFQAVISGEWNRNIWRGHDLAGQRLGIVGAGRIGRMVARYGLAFEMEVSAWDPYQRDWPKGIKKSSSLDELLSRSEVVTIHVPLNDETRHMFGKRELGLLPAGAILINTARGAVLDAQALVDDLLQGHLAGAALDVMEDEHDDIQRRESPVLDYARQHDNLLITPHIGGATVESMANTEVFMAFKLKRWVEDHT